MRFTGEDGEPLTEDAQYEYGTPAEAVKGPAIPQKEATAEFTYVFAGWDPAVENVTGDATYKATFEAVKNRYLITWIPDNGAAPETQELEYGATPEHGPVAKEATAEYTYTFTGWEPEIAPVTGDAVYTAAYSAEKKTYLITWRDEDGTDLGIVEMEYGAEPVHAVGDKDPTDEFVYAFAGWQPEVKPVTEDAVYTAVYQKTKRSYTVTWLDAAGEPMERLTVEYGVTPVHDGPAKEETETEAYAFTGWDPEVAPVTGDVVYTPVYRTIRKITVKGADESFEYDGQPHSSNHAVVASGELAEGDTLAAETVGSVTEVDQPCANTVDPKSVRVYRGEEDVTDEYRITLELGHLTVTPRKLVITTGSAEKPYDGTPLTCAADIGIEGLAEGDQIAVQATGVLTETGSAGNGFTIDWKKTRAANYEVVARPGTLTVTENPAEILLTAGSASKTYDGTELNENRITAEGLPAGFTVQVELSGGQTDVGTGVNTIEKWWILNAAGEDRTACFTGVKTAEGALEVTPRTLTVTTQDAGKEYDGQPLTAGTVTVEGLVEGESVTAVATGSLTDVGMADDGRSQYPGNRPDHGIVHCDLHRKAAAEGPDPGVRPAGRLPGERHRDRQPDPGRRLPEYHGGQLYDPGSRRRGPDGVLQQHPRRVRRPDGEAQAADDYHRQRGEGLRRRSHLERGNHRRRPGPGRNRDGPHQRQPDREGQQPEYVPDPVGPREGFQLYYPGEAGKTHGQIMKYE